MKSISCEVLPALVLAVAVLVGGCASKDKLPESRRNTRNDDGSFAAGAGRPPTANTSYAFARILVTQGRDRDAMYVLARVIREHPRFLPAYNELAGVYVRADRLDDAINVLNTALQHAPGDGVLYNNLGMCYMLAGENDKAVEAFTAATQAMPSNPAFRANRATALGLVGKEEEAQEEYRTVLGELATLKNMTILARARDNQNVPPAPQDDAAPDAATDAATGADRAADDVLIPAPSMEAAGTAPAPPAP